MSPYQPEPHWFVRPGVLDESHPGLLNPTYDLLDYPVVIGRADDVFVTAANAAGEPVALSYETALDRVAKIAGVLRLLGVGLPDDVRDDARGGQQGAQAGSPDAERSHEAGEAVPADADSGPAAGLAVRLAADLPPLAAHLARLAVFRVGGTITDDPGAGVVVAASAEASPAPTGQGLSATQRTAVRRLPSHVEAVRLAAPGFSAELDGLVRDGRIEPAPALELPADLVVERLATATLTAATATLAAGPGGPSARPSATTSG